MGILERERERKQKKKHISDLLKLIKVKNEIKKINENKLKQELGIESSLKKFHKPVTEESEKYEKTSKEVVKSIQNALENISFSPLQS